MRQNARMSSRFFCAKGDGTGSSPGEVIPPNSVSSILQAGAQQKQAARAIDGARNQQNHATDQVNLRNTHAAEAIDESGGDMEVSTDSEGAGSQGRDFGSTASEPEQDTAGSGDGITRDDDGSVPLDLEA